MSFNIGQFRRTQFDDYRIDLNNEYTLITDIKVVSGVEIKNTALQYFSFENGKYYYLSFKIFKKNYEQNITVKLINDNLIDNEQILKEITVSEGNDYNIYSIIISPNGTYNKILFELNRTSIGLDVMTELEIIDFSILNNIVPEINKKNKKLNINDPIYNIGVQGPTGMLMCINGGEIRIGNSGIYQLTNTSINIDFIGFVIAKEDYFFMDYEYKSEEV